MPEVTSHRVTQVCDLIHRELSKILIHSVRDPRLVGVTLTQIRLTADLKEARIYFDAPYEGKALEDCLSALKKSAGFFRRELAKTNFLRYVPKLNFFYDDTRDVITQSDQIIRGLHNGTGSDNN